jgi:Ca2+-dependent lipid-binding protein
MDSNGKSDPYCIFINEKNLSIKSTIKKNTLGNKNNL